MPAKRDYKKEYAKFGSSEKAKKKRAALNRYNREHDNYGNGDGLDAAHTSNGIKKQSPSKNRGKTGEGGRTKGRKHNYPKTRKKASK